ncbi:hypothetical protein BDP55DRAFT_628039 [Colletotrichum godetiae]|uniref:Uncharacterized protein n=1 Tax=Colletotrichum godetiae TaxID=1209918 RepID=A0AAJ0F073_9PEZI|nr:uncharacterized protein BDP55DRAFT_628039 [Colletotrichum godetiae]KAK1690356.1 hypothetical protein BDP55DRAFT_628039 [Colletotrichum godetiae]
MASCKRERAQNHPRLLPKDRDWLAGSPREYELPYGYLPKYFVPTYLPPRPHQDFTLLCLLTTSPPHTRKTHQDLALDRDPDPVPLSPQSSLLELEIVFALPTWAQETEQPPITPDLVFNLRSIRTYLALLSPPLRPPILPTATLLSRRKAVSGSRPLAIQTPSRIPTLCFPTEHMSSPTSLSAPYLTSGLGPGRTRHTDANAAADADGMPVESILYLLLQHKSRIVPFGLLTRRAVPAFNTPKETNRPPSTDAVIAASICTPRQAGRCFVSHQTRQKGPAKLLLSAACGLR